MWNKFSSNSRIWTISIHELNCRKHSQWILGSRKILQALISYFYFYVVAYNCSTNQKWPTLNTFFSTYCCLNITKFCIGLPTKLEKLSKNEKKKKEKNAKNLLLVFLPKRNQQIVKKTRESLKNICKSLAW